MASFRGTIRSEALKMKTKLTVIISDTLQSTDRYPVVYLLHGLSGNTDDWSDGELGLASGESLQSDLCNSRGSAKLLHRHGIWPRLLYFIFLRSFPLCAKSFFPSLPNGRIHTLWDFLWAATAL